MGSDPDIWEVQKHADPTDPDPQHCRIPLKSFNRDNIPNYQCLAVKVGLRMKKEDKRDVWVVVKLCSVCQWNRLTLCR